MDGRKREQASSSPPLFLLVLAFCFLSSPGSSLPGRHRVPSTASLGGPGVAGSGPAGPDIFLLPRSVASRSMSASTERLRRRDVAVSLLDSLPARGRPRLGDQYRVTSGSGRLVSGGSSPDVGGPSFGALAGPPSPATSSIKVVSNVSPPPSPLSGRLTGVGGGRGGSRPPPSSLLPWARFGVLGEASLTQSRALSTSIPGGSETVWNAFTF